MATDETQNTSADTTPSEASARGAHDALERTLNGAPEKASETRTETNAAEEVDESLVADVEKQLAASITPKKKGTRAEPADEQSSDETPAQPAPEITPPAESSKEGGGKPKPAGEPADTPSEQNISPRERRMREQKTEVSTTPTETNMHTEGAAVEKGAGPETTSTVAETQPENEQEQEIAPVQPPEGMPTEAPRATDSAVAQPEARPDDSVRQQPDAVAQRPEPDGLARQQPTPADTQSPKAEPRQPDDNVRPEPSDNVRQQADGELPRLRTFKNDIAAAMKNQRTSRASIASAEQTRKEKRRQVAAQKQKSAPADQATAKESAWPLKRIAVVGGIVLLGIGGISALGFAGYILFTADSEPEITRVQPYNLIPTNTQEKIVITDQRPDALWEALARRADAMPLSLGEVGSLYFVTESENREVLASARGFFEHIDADVPSQLRRTLAEPFMLGVHSFDGAEPFLILNITNFETAFAGLLAWEQDMNSDLAPLFGPELEKLIRSGTSTDTRARSFSDLVLNNQDVRALTNDEGDIALLYAFPRRDTLVITTNAETLSEVFGRMRARTIVQ